MRVEGYEIDILVQGFAGITTWFGDDLETTTLFELTPYDPPKLDRRAASA